MSQIPEQIKKQAEDEFNAELTRKLIEKHKETLRLRQNRWVRIFPWRLKIERRDIPLPTEKERVDSLVRRLTDLGVPVREEYGVYTVQRTGEK